MMLMAMSVSGGVCVRFLAAGREKLLAAGMPEQDISENWGSMRKQLKALEDGTLNAGKADEADLSE